MINLQLIHSLWSNQEDPFVVWMNKQGFKLGLRLDFIDIS